MNRIAENTARPLVALAAFLALVFSPTVALAQSQITVGQMLAIAVQDNFASILIFMFGVFFIVGVGLVATGLRRLLAAMEGPNGSQTTSNALLTLAAGTFLIGMTSAIAVSWSTFGQTFDPSQLTAPANDGGINLIGSQGSTIETAFINFSRDVGPALMIFIRAVCIVMGLGVMGHALYQLSRLSEANSRATTGGAITKLVVGSLLINMPFVMNVIAASFGIDNNGVLSDVLSQNNSILSFDNYVGKNTGSMDAQEYYNAVLKAAFYLAMPFGFWAVAKGIMILKHSSDGRTDAPLGAAFTHIIAGVILANGEFMTCSMIATLAFQDFPLCTGL